MPAGEIGDAEVADFAGADEPVEGLENFFDGRHRVEGVELIDIDVVGLQAAETGVDGIEQVIARGADIVGAGAHPEGALGGDDDFLAAALESMAEDFFGHAGGVDVAGIKHVGAGFDADIDEAAGFGGIGVSHGAEELIAATEAAGAEAEDGDFEAGSAEEAGGSGMGGSFKSKGD